MFTIGEFSKICQVSVKTLHHYDKIDLLKPVKVDEFTGYRYYSQPQMEKMLLIQRLKRYGFSLEEIREFLDCTQESICFSILLKQKERLKQQMRQMQLIINEMSAHLQNFERTGDIMGYQKDYEIEVRETPVRAVLACRNKMGVDEFGKYYSTLYERVPKEKITPNGITGAIYYDENFNRECSDIELIVGIREKEKADKLMESTLCAVTVHKGGYSSLSDAYGALIAWIQENGYECNGAPYDIYVKTGFNSGLPVEEWETEVYFPVKKKE
ncbi:MAG: MerR family transcriptional regulator [Lachnospiraceae bacterium]|nr:MerR family transcriptional regulator [Lachnospiraceae bacterium]